MRPLLSFLLLTSAFCGAQPETAAELALLGQTPYVALLEDGAPLPPTAAEWKSLPPLQAEQQRNAVKTVLFLRYVQSLEESGRITPQIEFDSAGRSRAEEAPELLTDILQELADEHTGSRRRYVLNSALTALAEVYEIDPLQMLYTARVAGLTLDSAKQLTELLPLSAVFNAGRETGPDEQTIASDVRTQTEVVQRMTELLAAVQDTESAAAALPQMAALLPLTDTTLNTRLLIAEAKVPELPQIIPAMEAYQAAFDELMVQRRRLNALHWCGCPALCAVDYLLQ